MSSSGLTKMVLLYVIRPCAVRLDSYDATIDSLLLSSVAPLNKLDCAFTPICLGAGTLKAF